MPVVVDPAQALSQQAAVLHESLPDNLCFEYEYGNRDAADGAFAKAAHVVKVEVTAQRLVGEKHLRLGLRLHGLVREAIWFGRAEALAARARVAYRLTLDEYEDRERVQMVIEAVLD